MLETAKIALLERQIQFAATQRLQTADCHIRSDLDSSRLPTYYRSLNILVFQNQYTLLTHKTTFKHNPHAAARTIGRNTWLGAHCYIQRSEAGHWRQSRKSRQVGVVSEVPAHIIIGWLRAENNIVTNTSKSTFANKKGNERIRDDTFQYATS